MKLLIAYDGSPCSEAALEDLAAAGLPGAGEALILSVAEVWLPANGNAAAAGAAPDPEVEKLVRRLREKGKKAVLEAETLARHARQRLEKILPGWRVESAATYGSPAWEILSRAAACEPDLIVAGSHGRSAVGRLLLGSISQKVLAEAHCSVRIARGQFESGPRPLRIMIGFDGSAGAQAAVAAAAARDWPEGSEIRLVAIADPVMPSAIGRFLRPVVELVEEVNQDEREWIETHAAAALAVLRRRGLAAELRIQAGNPKKVLIAEADIWNADCIFVGANAAGSRFERFLIGSTSAAVAARAQCTVEAVRAK